MQNAIDTLTTAPSAVPSSTGFTRRFLLLAGATSAAVVLPCYWHRSIAAGDLASHTYNAWLAQLVAQGQAPGLYMAPQWNNILLDVALTRLGNLVGFGAAEKIVVPVGVLIFFWGAYALIAAATNREPWFLTPAIAMVAYGWTFQMGFLNYYLSLGFAFFSVACLWRGSWPLKLLGVIFAALSLLAHPVGFLWLAGTAAYVILVDRLPDRWRWMLFSAALLAILVTHFYISHHYRTYDLVGRHFYMYIGPDQLVVFGHRYRILAAVLLLLAMSFLLGALPLWSKAEFRLSIRTPIELWVLALFGIAMVWGDIVIPAYATGFTFLPQRLSTITSVMAFCILGCVRPQKWHLASLLACAAVFFSWMYQDTAVLNRMEAQAQSLVQSLPYGSRVIATLWSPPGWRVGPQHVVDRACIGRCFVYSNYEPSTRQFRIRVSPGGSPIVESSPAAGLAMSEGRYVVQLADLPLAQIYQCDARDITRLCMRELVAGEVNGRIGYHPPQ